MLSCYILILLVLLLLLALYHLLSCGVGVFILIHMMSHMSDVVNNPPLHSYAMMHRERVHRAICGEASAHRGADIG